MSDWQVGDLAVFVGEKMTPENAHRFVGRRKKVGETFRVIGVVGPICGDIGLVLDGVPSPHPTRAWSHHAYRKVRPDEHKSCEPEFITLLKRSKRKVSA